MLTKESQLRELCWKDFGTGFANLPFVAFSTFQGCKVQKASKNPGFGPVTESSQIWLFLVWFPETTPDFRSAFSDVNLLRVNFCGGPVVGKTSAKNFNPESLAPGFGAQTFISQNLTSALGWGAQSPLRQSIPDILDRSIRLANHIFRIASASNVPNLAFFWPPRSYLFKQLELPE